MTIVLPIKVRLVNPLLGAECSIGSNSHPIVLSLTTGTSGRLTGNPGKEDVHRRRQNFGCEGPLCSQQRVRGPEGQRLRLGLG